jgi:hypothetical protein
MLDRSGQPPSFEGWQEIRDRLDRRPGVRATGAAIQLAGVLMNGDRSVAFVGAAVEPARQRRMGIEVKLRAGSPLPDEAPGVGD